jgi:hypothetical protein
LKTAQFKLSPNANCPGIRSSHRLRDGPEFNVFRRKAARFAIDNERALRDANPSCPESLAQCSDRAADAWSPLFAIAQVAGGAWLERAHRAALVLSGLQDDAGGRGEAAVNTDDELALLVDIRTILLAIDALAPEAKDLRTDKQIAVKALTAARELAGAGKAPDKLPKITSMIGGEQLANALGLPALFPDRGWSEWRHSRPIKLRYFGNMEYCPRLSGCRIMPGSGGVLAATHSTTPSLVMFLFPPYMLLGAENRLKTLTTLKLLRKTPKRRILTLPSSTTQNSAEIPVFLRASEEVRKPRPMNPQPPCPHWVTTLQAKILPRKGWIANITDL